MDTDKKPGRRASLFDTQLLHKFVSRCNKLTFFRCDGVGFVRDFAGRPGAKARSGVRPLVPPPGAGVFSQAGSFAAIVGSSRARAASTGCSSKRCAPPKVRARRPSPAWASPRTGQPPAPRLGSGGRFVGGPHAGGARSVGSKLGGGAPTPWAQVGLRGVRVERVRAFGQVYLALALWRRLGWHTRLQELRAAGHADVPWELTACILRVARCCG